MGSWVRSGSRAPHESAGAWGQGFRDRDDQNEKVRGVFILPARYCERSVTGDALPTRHCHDSWKGGCAAGFNSAVALIIRQC
jgi:hypothetical protein